MLVDSLVLVHVVAGVTLFAVTLFVGFWGLLRAPKIADNNKKEGKWFTQTLQLSHTLVLATCLIGLALLIEGHRTADPLHVRVYGVFMVVAIITAYGYRTDDAMHNVKVFAAAALVVAALGIRAMTTGA